MWNKVLFVLAAVGVAACGDASAKGKVAPPPELMVTIALGPDSALDSIRTFASAVKPGAGMLLTPAMLNRVIASKIDATAIDGIDPKAPRFVLIVDGGPALSGAAFVGKVSDARLLNDGLGTASLLTKDGWGIVGPKAIIEKVATYAFGTLVTQPAATSPSATVNVPQVLARYRTEVEAARKQMAAQMAASNGQVAGMMQVYVDGLFSALTDSGQLVLTVDATKDVGAVDLAIVPKTGSRLAKFVAVQKPSDYALLGKLPATPLPMLMAGHIESGPYRDGMLELFGSMYGQSAPKEMVETISAIMKASNGDLALGMQFGIGKPMAITQLFGLADKKSVDKAIDQLLELFKTPRTLEAMGISTTVKAAAPTTTTGGVAVRGYDIVYDYSKTPAKTREMMEKMLPDGKISARVATFDQLGILAMAGDISTVVDAAHGKAKQFAPTASISSFLTGSKGRKESLMIMMDIGAIANQPGPAKTVIMSAGFADGNAHLRVTMPTTTIRAFAGTP